MSMQSNGMPRNLNVKPIMPDIVINTGSIIAMVAAAPAWLAKRHPAFSV